jgi:ElaB/YqjD/DUF883 family membrane-anchored ribosome-binding protein
MNTTLSNTGSDLEAMTERIAEGVRRGQFTLAELQGRLGSQTRRAAESTDLYVHENPWPAIGAAAGAGFLAGFFMSRSRTGGVPEYEEAILEYEEEPYVPSKAESVRSVWSTFQAVLPVAVLAMKTLRELRSTRL